MWKLMEMGKTLLKVDFGGCNIMLQNTCSKSQEFVCRQVVLVAWGSIYHTRDPALLTGAHTYMPCYKYNIYCEEDFERVTQPTGSTSKGIWDSILTWYCKDMFETRLCLRGEWHFWTLVVHNAKSDLDLLTIFTLYSLPLCILVLEGWTYVFR